MVLGPTSVFTSVNANTHTVAYPTVHRANLIPEKSPPCLTNEIDVTKCIFGQEIAVDNSRSLKDRAKPITSDFQDSKKPDTVAKKTILSHLEEFGDEIINNTTSIPLNKLPVNSVSENLKEQIAIREEFLALKNDYKKKLILLAKIRSAKKTFDQILSIIQNNHGFILLILKFFLDKEFFEIIELNINDKEKFVKSLKSVFSVTYFELYFLRQYQKNLVAFHAKHYLKNGEIISVIVKKCKKLEAKNSVKRSNINTKCFVKLLEFSLCKVLPFLIFTVPSIFSISLIKNLEKKTLAKIFKYIFKFFKSFSRMNKLWKAIQIEKNWVKSHQISNKPTHGFNEAFRKFMKTEENPKKKRSTKTIQILIDKYEAQTGKSAYKEKAIAQEKIEQEKLDFENKVLLKRQDLIRIRDIQNLDLYGLKKELLSQGFLLSNIQHIETMDEWKANIETTSFFTEMCRNAVSHQITMGKLLKNGTEVMVLKKVKVEKAFLIFNMLQCIADFLFNLTQFILVIPKAAVHLSKLGCKQAVEFIGNSLSDKFPMYGANFLYFLDPQIDISIFGILNTVVTYLFGYLYKSNEFSINGYLYSLKLRWYRILYNLLSILKLVTKSCRLIDKYILKNSKFSLEKSKFQISLKRFRTHKQKKYDAKIHIFKHKLTQLKKLDFNKNLNPLYDGGYDKYQEMLRERQGQAVTSIEANNQAKKLERQLNEVKYTNLKAYLKENNCPKDILNDLDNQLKSSVVTKQLNTRIDQFLISKSLYKRQDILDFKVHLKYNYNQINVLKDALKQSDRALFLPETVEFFNKELNLSIGAGNAEQQIEKLFTSTTTSFFKYLDVKV